MNAEALLEVQRQVAAYIERRTGLSFSGAQGRRLREVVSRTLPDRPVMTDAGAPVSEELFAGLCEELTVQESYFFREPGKLSLVEEYIVPAVRGRRTPLRVWSAGCATGEEAYTVADVLTNAGLAGRYRILGTDLSPAAVSAARRGTFTKWSVRGLDAEPLSRLFEVTGSRYRVVEGLRENVVFEQHNLLEPARPSWGRFDLVLCRNVLIYFTPTAAREVITRLAESLAPGGWLLLGVSDPVADDIPGLETVVTEHGLAYRLRHRDEASAGDVARLPRTTASEPAQGPALKPRRASRRAAVAAGGRRTDRSLAPRGSGTRERQPTAPDNAPGNAPKDVLEAAEEALRLARPAEAERLARSVVDASPDVRVGHLLLVQALAEQARTLDAEAAAARAVSLFQEDAEVRYLQSVVLLERGNAAGAAAVARQTIYLDPRHPQAHLVLGRAYELLGEPVAAERARRAGCRLIDQRSQA